MCLHRLAISAATFLSLAFVAPAASAQAIVDDNPWGSEYAYLIAMDRAFGVGGYGQYNFSDAPANALFSHSNSFVFLDGGAGTDLSLASFLSTNSTTITNWVNGGGRLLLQSAGWNDNIVFAGVTLQLTPQYVHANASATLTTVGASLFSYTAMAATQWGNWVSHDAVVGSGLTTFMTGDQTGDAVLAGKAYGNGYIMFSGLTAPNWQSNASGDAYALLENTARATATSSALAAVPGPLAGVGFPALLGVIGYLGRRRRLA